LTGRTVHRFVAGSTLADAVAAAVNLTPDCSNVEAQEVEGWFSRASNAAVGRNWPVHSWSVPVWDGQRAAFPARLQVYSVRPGIITIDHGEFDGVLQLVEGVATDGMALVERLRHQDDGQSHHYVIPVVPPAHADAQVGAVVRILAAAAGHYYPRCPPSSWTRYLGDPHDQPLPPEVARWIQEELDQLAARGNDR
jgi:hypothetical protein